ncbi:MAG: M48 family metallopeptidase [Gammaproteobacteria bacterium]|nr:M48 family metallopeptidase [Gammaproteobacteria bacterium]MBU0788388.1 M48 family metallopeptidase [Gammaproteobacteria bacterium]MBU0815755.1 M48 family metallopeptidase [Gammaproteobacteria bacterium]MBU1788236.1 M48 family metallopeptidase [Gammaproteobacteria bacterium]
MFIKNLNDYRHSILLAAGLLVAGCQTIQTTQPGTVGVVRTQSMAVSSEQMDQASTQAYDKMLKQARAKNALNRDAEMLARVRGVANRLIRQTVVFRSDAPAWRWDVNIFQSNEINAFCMAGGKIGVYSGLVSQLGLTDAELAAVLGHEIAHALREHVREQVSLQYAMQLPGLLISVVTGSQALAQLGDMVGDVTLGLPRSRQAESEGDVIGVELAARAGYDPRAAISLWQKMNKLGGASKPEFLSTHPSPATREEDLAMTAEIVMPLYRKAVKP